MRLPDGASRCTSVPPPAPDPITITSYELAWPMRIGEVGRAFRYTAGRHRFPPASAGCRYRFAPAVAQLLEAAAQLRHSFCQERQFRLGQAPHVHRLGAADRRATGRMLEKGHLSEQLTRSKSCQHMLAAAALRH